MKIANDITELVGNTPLVRLNVIGKDLKPEIIVKLEYFNPSCSVKDRAALNMILEAEKNGELHPGSTIVEATSGNTGIGLATIAASRGYKLILVIPDTMSEDKIKHIRALGAEVRLTPGVFGMKKAFLVAQEINDSIQGSFQPNQVKNKANPDAHIKTGKEILMDTDGVLDYFVAGAGTGGTITGIARVLKKHNQDIKIVCVEPRGSAVLSEGKRGPHKLQGIGPGFIPDILDLELIDEIIAIDDDDALNCSRMLAKREGIFVGISSGAAVSAALKIAERNEGKKIRIVTLLPDTGERYLSTELFDENIKDNFVS